jgi:serine protease Do
LLPGEPLELKVWRGGRVLSLQAFLMERPEGSRRRRARAVSQGGSGAPLGLSLAPLTDQLSEYFDAPGGVLVTRVEEGRAAAIAGVLAGDVIVAVDEVEVRTVEQLQGALAGSEEPAVLLAVVRNGNDIFIQAALD